MRILLLGGSKSGKSMLGQRLTRQLADGGPMIYWATLEPRDTEDRAIVCRHLAERDGWGFGTLERGRALPEGLELVPREGAVLAVGNAPTALLTIVEEIENGLRPALVIGVPVGFVNVVESKERLFAVCTQYGVPAIVAMGRKGGSNVAAAICNALIYSAAEMLDPAARGWQ